MSKTLRLVNLLTSTFEKDAWYGPAVMEVLADIKPEDAQKRAGDSHSVIQLVGHMTAWRTFTIRKLQGDHEFDIKTDEMNFPFSEDWHETLGNLKNTQEQLIKLLEVMDEAKLSEEVPGRGYTFHALIHGIIQHDIYHLGQIQLIRRYC